MPLILAFSLLSYRLISLCFTAEDPLAAARGHDQRLRTVRGTRVIVCARRHLPAAHNTENSELAYNIENIAEGGDERIVSPSVSWCQAAQRPAISHRVRQCRVSRIAASQGGYN